MLVGTLALALLTASSQVTEYTQRTTWEAVAGTLQCADFQGFFHGTPITNQYASIGLTLTQGDDTVFGSTAFVTDLWGVECNGDMELVFSPPRTAIGFDFPGGLHLEAYSGGANIWSSTNFGGLGTGFFAGLTSTAGIDRIVVSDWHDGLAYVDNICLGGSTAFTIQGVGACPGGITVRVTNATANGRVALAYGLPGSTTKPNGLCAGTTVLLARPKVAVVVLANGSGAVDVTAHVPMQACGLSVQAVDLMNCATSNVIVL